jgi:hypothetical protein
MSCIGRQVVGGGDEEEEEGWVMSFFSDMFLWDMGFFSDMYLPVGQISRLCTFWVRKAHSVKSISVNLVNLLESNF